MLLYPYKPSVYIKPVSMVSMFFPCELPWLVMIEALAFGPSWQGIEGLACANHCIIERERDMD